MKNLFGRRKWAEVFAIVTILILTLNGCATVSALLRGEFDATGYVKGLMDSTYKGDYTEYLKLTDDSEENASVGYDSWMEATGENLASYSGIQIISDNVRSQFTDITKAIYQKAKYEVKDAVKVDNSYQVEVVISPMNILNLVSPEIQTYITEFNARNDKGEFAELTEEQFEDEYASGVIDIFKKNIDKIGYGDNTSITVTVQLDADKKYYEVSDEEFTNLDQAMFIKQQ